MVRLSFAVAGAPHTRSASALSRRILLVDDDPVILGSLREALEREGHQVEVAIGGHAGLGAFLAAKSAGQRFEVVITDLGMPYLDGMALSLAVKRAEPQTVVFLLTGWGQRIVEEEEAPSYVDAVLTKPPRVGELRRALARAFGEG